MSKVFNRKEHYVTQVRSQFTPSVTERIYDIAIKSSIAFYMQLIFKKKKGYLE